MAELRDIRGIGPATAVALADHGLTSVKKLAKAGIDAIIAVPGFGPIRAAAVRAEARAVIPAKDAKPEGNGAKAKPQKAKAKAKSGKGSKSKPAKAKPGKGAKAKSPKGAKAKATKQGKAKQGKAKAGR